MCEAVAPGMATSPRSVRQAIARFHREAADYNDLPYVFPNFRRWYSHRDRRGQWLFGPSKVVGYEGMDFETYERLYLCPDCLDGRHTEAHLQNSGWFTRLGHKLLDEPESRHRDTFKYLAPLLSKFLAGHGRHPWGAQAENAPPFGKISIDVFKNDFAELGTPG